VIFENIPEHKSVPIQEIIVATDNLTMKVWQCHPKSARVIPAEKTLQGTANESGVKWCGPYKYANQLGWWLFPPVDVDIMWKGGKEFEHKLIEPYSDADAVLARQLMTRKEQKNTNLEIWCPQGVGRTKFTWGAVDVGVVQFWTGCIFETPPGWGLQIRSPINCHPRSIYIMEGVLETDWLQYDIWFNMVFTKENEWVSLRKDGWPPLAQLIPIRREVYANNWQLEQETINRDTPESNRVFEFWMQYNDQKFCHGGRQSLTEDGSMKKDATTYHRERMRCLGKNIEPLAEEIAPQGCPVKPKLTGRLVKKKRGNTSS
jgi:hypothetical protein